MCWRLYFWIARVSSCSLGVSGVAALHVDPRRAAADHVDVVDLRGWDPVQDLSEIVLFGGRAGAVDQHIAGRPGETADLSAAVEGEARQTLDHVEGGVGPHLGEIGGRIGDDGRIGARGRDDRRADQNWKTHGRPLMRQPCGASPARAS